MDSEQRRDASGVKTHEEIQALLKELDIIEKRVKTLQSSEDSSAETDAMLQDAEIIGLSAETIQEPRPELPIDLMHRHTRKKQSRSSLFDLYKKRQTTDRTKKHRIFSEKREQVPLEPPVEPEMHHPKKERRKKEKPEQSTFTLFITEEGTLSGLDIKKSTPPKPQKGLLRRHTTETGAQPQDVEEPGFKGTLKRLVKKIIPRASNRGEANGGIGSRIKGIVKRKPKEQK